MVKSCDSLVLPLPLSTKNVINKNASAAVRKNVVVELFDLPEDILIRIFCFMETKFAVQTCLLFKQWNHLWTILPILNFNTSNVDYRYPFGDFYSYVLKHSQLFTLQCLNFSFDSDDWINDDNRLLYNNKYTIYVNSILNAIKSSHVEQLSIDCDSDSFPVHLLTCQQLKVLKLRGGKLQEFINFSTLKILHLKDVNGECFWLEDARHHKALSLSFANLEELIFHKVSLSGYISELILTCPKLVSLSISKIFFCVFEIKVSAPKLAFFSYSCKVLVRVLNVEDEFPWQLKTAYLDIYPPFKPYPWDHHDLSNIMNVFKVMRNAKSLILTSNTIEALSMFPWLLEKEHFPFNYLRSLKVGVKNLKTPKVEANERIGSLDSIPDKVMNFLCRNTANEEILELKYETTYEEKFMDARRYSMLDPSGDYLITRLSRP